MKITKEALLNLDFKESQSFPDMELMIGSVRLIIRIQSGKAYCELSDIYVGEIKDMHQLNSLFFGLTGRDLYERLKHFN